MTEVIKSIYPEAPIFDGDNQDPVLVCDNLKKNTLYVYCLVNGKRKYEFIHFEYGDEIAKLFGGYSAVKYGRHWWL